MEFQTNIYSNGFVNEFPDKQPPATSYPDPQKRDQTAPMNPTPDISGADDPSVGTGTAFPKPDEEEDSLREESNQE